MKHGLHPQQWGRSVPPRAIHFLERTVAPPMMVNFDSANREACVVRENRTNTPLQALKLMNDTTFLESARFIGQRHDQRGRRGIS